MIIEISCDLELFSGSIKFISYSTNIVKVVYQLFKNFFIRLGLSIGKNL